MRIICWWSGGITSAVACKIAIDLFGHRHCDVIMIDTHNEDDDTYRFKKDCEKWYKLPITSITRIGGKYPDIQSVWESYQSLNVASGAICSTVLKREIRQSWQKNNPEYTHQIFGFEFDKKEFNRALSMYMNHPDSKPIFPLLMMGYDKKKCLSLLIEAGINPPVVYAYGFKNNNCFKTGCVQGGVGYWKKMQRDFPDKFGKMADMEHKLTDKKGTPVTMLKDQSKEAKAKTESNKFANLVFLRPHPDYPELKSIDDMKDRGVEPLMECNGFCGINDLNSPSQTQFELNFEE
jgi:hypothetical protein